MKEEVELLKLDTKLETAIHFIAVHELTDGRCWLLMYWCVVGWVGRGWRGGRGERGD